MLVCHFVIDNLNNPVDPGFLNNNSEQSKFEESKSPRTRSSAKMAFLADVDGGPVSAKTEEIN